MPRIQRIQFRDFVHPTVSPGELSLRSEMQAIVEFILATPWMTAPTFFVLPVLAIAAGFVFIAALANRSWGISLLFLVIDAALITFLVFLLIPIVEDLYSQYG